MTKPFIPSPQQQALFDWVENGQGSAIVRAVAGAGKTTSLIEALRRMNGNVFLGAFNRKIADEIKAKAAEAGVARPGIFISTMHGAGYSAWRRLAPSVKVNDSKVRDILDSAAKRKPAVAEVVSPVAKLVSFGKHTLAGVKWKLDDFERWLHLIDHYGVDQDVPEGVSLEQIAHLASWVSRKSLDSCHEVIDFDDMLLAPIAYDARFYRNDWVLIDEAQDTNQARRELARRMLRPGGRLIAVGDDKQAIYGFTGADAGALDLISKDFKCTWLPLTVSYRCPRAVVAVARTWVDHIEAHPDAPEGEARPALPSPEGRPWWHSERPGAADAILCRYTKPLVETAFAMIREGIPCRIEGRDIGRGLISLVRRWKVQDLEKLEERLDAWLDREIEKARAKRNETKEAQVLDKVAVVRVFMDRARLVGEPTVDGVVRQIETMFADEVTGILTLSTIHKSKGREWPRVFWLQSQDRNRPMKDWEVESERCVKYVAATRAQQSLIMVPA